jgi:hypothetical protein
MAISASMGCSLAVPRIPSVPKYFFAWLMEERL